MNLAIIGNIAFDIIEQPNQKIVNLGGAAFYAGVSASLFQNVAVVGNVGEDFPLGQLKKFDIDLRFIKQWPNQKTTKFTTRFLSSDGQQRIIEDNINQLLIPTKQQLTKEILQAKYIHICTNQPSVQLDLLLFLRVHSNAIISVDTIDGYLDDPKISQVFDNADIAFINHNYTPILNCKAPVKIIKNGKHGCTYQSNQKSFEVKSHLVEHVVDKVGAGDCLIGAFLSLVSLGNSVETALRKAVDVATQSVKNYGVEHLYLLKNNNFQK